MKTKTVNLGNVEKFRVRVETQGITVGEWDLGRYRSQEIRLPIQNGMKQDIFPPIFIGVRELEIIDDSEDYQGKYATLLNEHLQLLDRYGWLQKDLKERESTIEYLREQLPELEPTESPEEYVEKAIDNNVKAYQEENNQLKEMNRKLAIMYDDLQKEHMILQNKLLKRELVSKFELWELAQIKSWFLFLQNQADKKETVVLPEDREVMKKIKTLMEELTPSPIESNKVN